MPNLFSSLRECFGFSQIITSPLSMVSMALLEMSFKFPIGVATMFISKELCFIVGIFIFIFSCTPVNLSKQSQQSTNDQTQSEEKVTSIKKEQKNDTNKQIFKTTQKNIEKFKIKKNITLLFSTQNRENFTKQFINILELGIYNKNLENVVFEIEFFENNKDLENIIIEKSQKGKIFIGPIQTQYTKSVKKFCDNEIIFFSFSSDTSLASDCIYLINFFPKNELEQLFLSLDKDSKVAFLYPENDYGYKINYLIDDVINNSDSILVNRASYKNDLSNVRDAIKELGKYELRKYELERQKIILASKSDEQSKNKLKKLKKFKTTSDYEFTHILLADYGLNLLQVAPLLPYYDIDPNVVQFLSTGVIDDDNFFIEPSLQGAIFPGVEKTKRQNLINQYRQIYDEKLLRISTLPYDLVGLLNYVFSRNLSYQRMIELLNNSQIKFEGVDGEFYFKNNLIERDLDMLRISNGIAKKIN